MQKYVFPVLMLVLAGTLQGNIPAWMVIKGARPDLILVVLIAMSLELDPGAGAVLGFLAGLIHGSLVGISIGSFIASRTIIGFAAGFVTIRMFSENPLVPVVAAGALTFVGEVMFLLANPVTGFFASINVVLFKALYNSLLTLFLFWFIRWMHIRRKIKMAAARL